MGRNPANSVVDVSGSVHGLDNLFIVGGSVFVGGSGSVQPTLTMTALAMRTADYLVDQIGSIKSISHTIVSP